MATVSSWLCLQGCVGLTDWPIGGGVTFKALASASWAKGSRKVGFRSYVRANILGVLRLKIKVTT
jgi:hypothetical protein